MKLFCGGGGHAFVYMCVFYWDSHTFSLCSFSVYLPLSLTMLKAIVALKPSETLEERTSGVESHPAACGL